MALLWQSLFQSQAGKKPLRSSIKHRVLKAEEKVRKKKEWSAYPLGQSPHPMKGACHFYRGASTYLGTSVVITPAGDRYLWHSSLHNQAHHDNVEYPSMKQWKRAAVALCYPRPERQLRTFGSPNPVLTGDWTSLSPCLGEVLPSSLF